MNKIVRPNIVELTKLIDKIYIIELVNKFSNDTELGKELREYYNYCNSLIENRKKK
jgi:hypothetical protein